LETPLRRVGSVVCVPHRCVPEEVFTKRAQNRAWRPWAKPEENDLPAAVTAENAPLAAVAQPVIDGLGRVQLASQVCRETVRGEMHADGPCRIDALSVEVEKVDELAGSVPAVVQKDKRFGPVEFGVVVLLNRHDSIQLCFWDKPWRNVAE
jgi:hypothetical protein